MSRVPLDSHISYRNYGYYYLFLIFLSLSREYPPRDGALLRPECLRQVECEERTAAATQAEEDTRKDPRNVPQWLKPPSIEAAHRHG